MKIAISTESSELYNSFVKVYKKLGYETVNVRSESTLFENIRKGDIDAFILETGVSFLKKATDLIKRVNPYTPIIVMIVDPLAPFTPYNVDAYMHRVSSAQTIAIAIHNVSTYIKSFSVLRKLINKPSEPIVFGDCVYDPSRRVLTNRGVEVKKFSTKEGGILELLAMNYKEVVKKELILEKVWGKSDYFTGRSCDVYITYIRNTFKKHSVDLKITNISNVGLTLE